MALESRRNEARWGRIALGWLVAVLAGVLVSPLIRALFGLRAEPPGDGVSSRPQNRLPGLGLPGISGRWVPCGQACRLPWGLNGAMTAVLGMVFGMMLAVLGVA